MTTPPVIGYRDNAPLISQSAFQVVVDERDRLLAALNAKGRCLDMLRLVTLNMDQPDRMLACSLTFDHDGAHTDGAGCSWTKTDTRESIVAGHLRDGLVYRGVKIADDEDPVLVAYQVIDELRELASAWEQTARQASGELAAAQMASTDARRPIVVPVAVNNGVVDMSALGRPPYIHLADNGGGQHEHQDEESALACFRANGGTVLTPS